MILGDILHSRVARSNIWTLTAAGADLWLCGPSTLLRGFEAWALRGVGCRTAVPRDGVDRRRAPGRRRRHGAPDPEGADGVAGCSRRSASTRPDTGSRSERLALARPDALVMHPGPMNEGVEIAPDVAAGTRSLIEEQVRNGVAVRMALLYLLAGVRG